jgi:hypothetical protein
MSIEKQRIEMVKGEVHDSDLRPSHKADISDLLLRAGNATNGTPDKTQALTEAVASLAICFARDALYRREDLRELIDAALTRHQNDCPLAQDTTFTRGRDGRDGRDSITIAGKWGRATTGKGVVLYVSTLGFVGWIGFLVAKGAKWI